MTRIDFRQVCKRYAHNLPLTINDTNIEIGSRDFCVFVGPSGCGKSTLLRMVAGVEEITSGDILIGGVRVSEMASVDRGVAMVFQSYALYPTRRWPRTCRSGCACSAPTSPRSSARSRPPPTSCS